MKTDLHPCRYCKCSKAETFKAGDLWYVRCLGTKKTKTSIKPCAAWGRYEFLGLTEKAAIDNWNERNQRIKHVE